MKLLASPRSPFVRKVRVAIHELGLAERIAVVPVAVHMHEVNPEVLAENPLGKIPTLILEDGTAIYDSFVIIDVLERLAGRNLVPPHGAERTWALKHHALANGLMDLTVLWRNERDKPESRQTSGWIDNFAEKTCRTLDRLDATMPDYSDRPFGLAHIATAVVLSYLDYRFDHLRWRDGRPALAAWQADAAARPSMIATQIVA